MAENDTVEVRIVASDAGFRPTMQDAAAQVRALQVPTSGLRSNLKDMGFAFDDASGAVRGFQGEMKHVIALFDEFSRGARGQMTASLGAMIRDAKGFSLTIGGLIGAAGLAMLAKHVAETAVKMAELGERTVDAAAAIGTTPHEFSQLAGALKLVTGDGDIATQTLMHLGRSLEEALTQKTSQAAKAAASLGISQGELRHASTDLGYAIDLLADKFVEFQNSPLKTADYMALLGRGFQRLIPLLRQGSGGLDEFKQKAEDTGIVLSNQDAQALADTGEHIHELSAALEGAGVRSFMAYKGAIDASIEALKDFIAWTGRVIAAIPNLLSMVGNAMAVASGVDIQAAAKAGLSVSPFGRSTRAAEQASYDTGQNFFGTGSRQVGAWPQSGGRGRSKKDQEGTLDQWLREVQHVMQESVRAEIQAADQMESRDRSLESIFESNMKRMVDAKKITLAQAAGFEAQYTAQLMAEEKKRLETIMADDRATAEEKGRAYDQLLQLDADYARKVEEQEKDAAKTVKDSWTDTLKSMSDQLATFASDAITKPREIAKAFDNMVREIIDDFLKANFKSLFNSMFGLGGGGSSGASGGTNGASGGMGIFGSLIGGLMGDAMKAAIGNPFSSGSGGLLGGTLANLGIGAAFSNLLTGGAAGQAADVAAMWGGGGASDVLSGMMGGGSILSKLASALPAAAGGWDIPHFASGGIVAQVHSGEMVLPQHLADGVRGAIEGGGFGGGGHTFNISAVDGASVARLFMQHGSALVAALNRATRNGSMLAQPT